MSRLLALEAALLGAFVALALYTTGEPQPIDLEILAAIQGWDAPWFRQAMAAITYLGDATVLVPAVLVALSVGLSRVALGVHWPTDVVAGYAMGGALLAAGITAMRRFGYPSIGGRRARP